MNDKTDKLPTLQWRELIAYLEVCDESEAKVLLDLEKATDNRPAYVQRIYGRYSVLRAEREKRTLKG